MNKHFLKQFRVWSISYVHYYFIANRKKGFSLSIFTLAVVKYTQNRITGHWGALPYL